MTEAAKVRTTVLPSDIDAQGNVTVWDHGPLPLDPVPAADSDEAKRWDAENKEWHRVNGDGPVPVLMESSSARHALAVEPARWSIEPVDAADAEVTAEIAEIKKRRDADAKASADRLAAAQLVEDRKAAIATVMARRKAKLETDKTAAKAPKPVGKVETGLETAARLAEKKADDDAADANRIRNDSVSTPEAIEAARAKAADSRTKADAARQKADNAKGAKA